VANVNLILPEQKAVKDVDNYISTLQQTRYSFLVTLKHDFHLVYSKSVKLIAFGHFYTFRTLINHFDTNNIIGTLLAHHFIQFIKIPLRIMLEGVQMNNFYARNEINFHTF